MYCNSYSIKSSLFGLVVLFSFSRSYSQLPSAVRPGKNKISGKITDAGSRLPMEYATITLADQTTKKPVTGAITNDKGLFSLVSIRPGTYTLTVESIGYSPFVKNNIIIPNENPDSLMEVSLEKKSGTLQTVVVNASRPLIENKLDKLVYNVDKDITSQGGIATDALKKIPGVTVDIDGNVELLGNPSVRFLIDGKPSAIFGNSAADALQSIPSSQIQSIEVITSPGAKYDAAGTGGIINIILKKSKIEGFNGTINASAGTRLENGSLTTGWKKNRVGINAYFSGNAQLKASTPNSMDRITDNNPQNGYSRFLQDSKADFSRNGFKSGIGMDWAISKKDNLSATLAYNHFGNKTNGNTNQSLFQYDPAGNLLSEINSLRYANTKMAVNTFDNSLEYKRKLKKDGEELSIGYEGSYDKNNTSYSQSQQYIASTTPFAGSSSLNPGQENESNFSIDYVHPFNEKTIMEMGGKTTFQSIISNANVLTLNAMTGNYVSDATQSYRSDYRRRIDAGYLSFNFSLFKFLDIKVGGRYEHTSSDAFYSNAPKTAIPPYNNFAPSFIISHSFSNKESLKFSYSYRLERPDYRDLNPFINLSDPHNISTGNPNLQPEIGHNYELGYNKSFENGANINLLLFYQKNSPDIKSYLTYYPTLKIGDSTYTDVTLTSRADIAAEIRPGISISVSVPAGKKLNFRTNTQLFNRKVKNPYSNPPVISAFGFRTNMNITYQFNKTLVAEIFGNYNLGMRWQGRQASVFSYTFAFRKQFLNNKASFGFVAVDPFNKYIDQKSLQTATGFNTHIERKIPYRSFGISFMYKFGKLKFTKPKEGDNYLYSPPVEN